MSFIVVEAGVVKVVTVMLDSVVPANPASVPKADVVDTMVESMAEVVWVLVVIMTCTHWFLLASS